MPNVARKHHCVSGTVICFGRTVVCDATFALTAFLSRNWHDEMLTVAFNCCASVEFQQSGSAMFTIDRNEFVDPSCQDQSVATLVFKKQRIACRLNEVSVAGFSVVIPREITLTGTRGRLVTLDGAYTVHVLNQEACDQGSKVTLERLDEPYQEELVGLQGWIVHGSRCCAIGLILAIAYCAFANPQFDLQELANGLMASVPSAATMPPDRSNPATTSAASRESTKVKPASAVSQSTVPVKLDRNGMLREAIAQADSGRSRPVNPSTLPWLFTGTSARNLPRCRMTQLAEQDLRVFENGLKLLPPRDAADALNSLRNAVAAIPISASSVTSFPGVRRTASDDAEILFRVRDGEAEFLRVLPLELLETASRSVSDTHFVYR
jgi:hypothetical protein